MIKIYYKCDPYRDEEYFTFKIFLHGFLVVSGRKTSGIRGNKKRSGKISNIFRTSHLHNSTGRPAIKPDLKLWDEYLTSFQISEKAFVKWLDRSADMGFYGNILRGLKNKIINDKNILGV